MTLPSGGPPLGQRILVVDDEPDIVALIAYHLAEAGYRVSTASTGVDALETARRERRRGRRDCRLIARRVIGACVRC
jgi:DNA-binding response OmpR family regulator